MDWRETVAHALEVGVRFATERLRGALPPLAESLGWPKDSTLAVPASGQVLYRVVGRTIPRAYDFQSNRAKNRERYPRELYIDHLAVSMFESQELAIANAVRFPKLVAAVRLDGDHGFTLARTDADIRGHYNVWGDPEDLVSQVIGDTAARFDESG
jgi:hypothetical protein